MWGKQTLSQLALKYHKGPRWIQRQIELVNTAKKKRVAGAIIAAADTTFFGRGYGILVVRCPRLKRNLYFHEVATETPEEYRKARNILEAKGFIIEGAVVDGKRGLFNVFRDIPTQMCQFHQMAIVRRYLTSRPILEAGKELRAITLTLKISSEKAFTDLLDIWYDTWKEFLKEKTYSEGGKRWQHTHKRIRSAYRSLRTNLPHLFTYQKYPHLNIPNTTNSIDGFFSKLKSLLNVHRGMSPRKRMKLIREILFE